MLHAMQFARLCEALEAAKNTSSRNAKVSAIAAALAESSKSGELELRTAVRVALGDLSRLGVGYRALGGALAARLGETGDTAIVETSRRLGDLGDAAFELVAKRNEPAHAEPLTLADVDALTHGLRAATSRAKRAALITSALARSSALEVKFLVKALSGELRIGAAPGVVLLAVASAFEADETKVRRAHGLLADLAEVAVLAREGRLDEASIAPGRPLAFMLATPIETVKSAIDYGAFVAEEKLDGVRAQIHVHGGVVTIFARGLERVTESFPEVAAAFAGTTIDLVLDGEILAVAEDGRPRPFQALQMRLNRKKPGNDLLALVPVSFVAFDVLVRGDRALVDRPWRERRAALEEVHRDVPKRTVFTIKEAADICDAAAVDAAFDRARKNGNEGLVLKRKDSPYEAGKRGQSWLKVKKATATLDVVVTAAEQGHGGRANVISDYTFAVWKDGALVDVGKAYSGLTDPEIDSLSRHFIDATIERRGGWRKVSPDVVLEVGFDGIQRSDRHASGFSLRFPRILKIRSDKKPDECDTIETVEALYLAQVETGHREETIAPPAPKKKPTKSGPQLSLFEDAPPAAKVDKK
jgi:DNA ligase-1